MVFVQFLFSHMVHFGNTSGTTLPWFGNLSKIRRSEKENFVFFSETVERHSHLKRAKQRPHWKKYRKRIFQNVQCIGMVSSKDEKTIEKSCCKTNGSSQESSQLLLLGRDMAAGGTAAAAVEAALYPIDTIKTRYVQLLLPILHNRSASFGLCNLISLRLFQPPLTGYKLP